MPDKIHTYVSITFLIFLTLFLFLLKHLLKQLIIQAFELKNFSQHWWWRGRRTWITRREIRSGTTGTNTCTAGHIGILVGKIENGQVPSHCISCSVICSCCLLRRVKRPQPHPRSVPGWISYLRREFTPWPLPDTSILDLSSSILALCPVPIHDRSVMLVIFCFCFWYDLCFFAWLKFSWK